MINNKIEKLQKSIERRKQIVDLEKWFVWYDTQVAQYNRAVRLGEAFDKDINELDRQAKENAARLKQLRV